MLRPPSRAQTSCDTLPYPHYAGTDRRRSSELENTKELLRKALAELKVERYRATRATNSNKELRKNLASARKEAKDNTPTTWRPRSELHCCPTLPYPNPVSAFAAYGAKTLERGEAIFRRVVGDGPAADTRMRKVIQKFPGAHAALLREGAEQHAKRVNRAQQCVACLRGNSVGGASLLCVRVQWRRKFLSSDELLSDLACERAYHPSITRRTHRFFRSPGYVKSFEWEPDRTSYKTRVHDRVHEGVKMAAFPAPCALDVALPVCLLILGQTSSLLQKHVREWFATEQIRIVSHQDYKAPDRGTTAITRRSTWCTSSMNSGAA